MTSNFWRSVWTSVKVKSKNHFYFTDFFAKIYSLLTHVRSTPPLRSHYPRSSHTNIYGDASVAHTTKDRFMTVAILKCELIMCVAIVNFWTRFTKLHQCVLNTCALWARSLKPSIKYVSPFVHDFWRPPLLCQQLSAFQHPLPKKSVSLLQNCTPLPLL